MDRIPLPGGPDTKSFSNNLDKKYSDITAQVDKLSSKVQQVEKLSYDFRKDLTTNIHEVETHLTKRYEQLARTLQEVARPPFRPVNDENRVFK